MELKKFITFICILVAWLAISVVRAPGAWTSRHGTARETRIEKSLNGVEKQETTVKRSFALSELEKACILIMLIAFLGVIPYAIVMDRTKHGKQAKPAKPVKQKPVDPLEEAKKKVRESL